jgi:CyaY protein
MEDKHFQKHADAALERIMQGLQDFEDLGLDNTNDTIRIEFNDRSKLVVNRHTAARQIWLAAPSGAWHFACGEDGARWVDVRTGAEMYHQLETLIQEKLGRPVKLG